MGDGVDAWRTEVGVIHDAGIIEQREAKIH